MDNDLTHYIENLGIKCINIEYGKYEFKYWINTLNKVDFVIFYQNQYETQGLAMAEAWAHNKPTLIKGDVCPYLTNKTGLSWNSKEDLINYINEYHKYN